MLSLTNEKSWLAYKDKLLALIEVSLDFLRGCSRVKSVFGFWPKKEIWLMIASRFSN